MDSIFGLDEADRAAFFRHMMQSFGATYICLWSYSPLPSNCLKFLDGLYQEEASSSSGSLGRRLFDAYCGTLNYVDLGYVPGFAFKNNLPYMEMNLDYLQTIAHTEMQLQFYHRAQIKTIVFMGCAIGEIELGFSSAPQVNLKMGMRNWFPQDFSRQTHAELNLHHFTNQTLIPTSSSSVSLDSSIEIEGSCSPSCLFNNIPTQVLRLDPIHASTQIQFPTIENIDQETSSCSQNMSAFGRAVAFTSYRAGPFRIPTHKQRTLFKRAVLFYRELERRRTHDEVLVQGNMPTATQIHHVIQERRRREKLNESFEVLRTLVPQLSKKDKASVLSSTTEYITTLKSQVEELKNKNHLLETQLSTTPRERGEDQELGFGSERVFVEIERVSGEKRLVDLRVRLRSKECKLMDLVFGVLKMLKQHTDVSLLCVMQSKTRMMQESTPVHALILRLKIEGNEDFDEFGFEEAVTRIVRQLPN